MSILSTKIEGAIQELPIIESIGEGKTKLPSNTINLVTNTALERIQKVADDLFKAEKISTVSYENIKKGNDIIKKAMLWEWMSNDNVDEVNLFFVSPQNRLLIKDYLLISCHSTKMIQSLINNGLKIDSIGKLTIDVLANRGNWELIDYCVKQGLQLPLKDDRFFFQITAGPKSHYLSYPNIAQAIHHFIHTQVTENKDTHVWEGLSLYCAHRDLEGLKTTLEQVKKENLLQAYSEYYNFSDLMLWGIQNGHVEVLEALIPFFSLSNIKNEQQLKLSAAAVQLGYPEIQDFLERHHCSISNQDKLCLQSQREWREGADKTQPLKSYQWTDRSLNSAHKEQYGRGTAQEQFSADARAGVGYAVWATDAKRNKKEFAPSFSELLTILGSRRQHTAYVCNTLNAREFGSKRSEPIYTKIHGHYSAYEDRAKPFSIYVTIDGEKILLTDCRGDPLDTQNTYELANHYKNFWRENDSVFRYAEQLYNKIATQTFDNEADLRREIGTLHWLLANVVPFDRGSASVTEILTDALWLHHGFIPQPFEKGKSLDLEALFSPNLEDFLAIYPMGKKLV